MRANTLSNDLIAAASDAVEAERLAALDRYDILDTPREGGFDRIARLVKNIFGVSIAAVSFIDAHRQWLKAGDGVEAAEFALRDTFCRHAIGQGGPLVVSDASKDARFAANPMVTGAAHVRSYAGVQLRTSDGHDIGTVCAIDTSPRNFTPREIEILTDLAQLTMNEIELRSLAATDPLTGLPNRRAFTEAVTAAISLARRHSHNLACIALDLDHFKSINDTHGHGAGDRVLNEVARVCRRNLRRTDIVGRLGGEEFAIALPHTDVAAAAEVAEKLRLDIEATRFEFGNVNVGVTASFGVSGLERRKADFETLLADADAALYEAKGAGRNRCISHEPQMDAAGVVRRRVLKAGRIIFNGRRSVIDCTVRTLGVKAAGLNVSETQGIPRQFTLSIPCDTFETEVRVVSKDERHLEVAFV